MQQPGTADDASALPYDRTSTLVRETVVSTALAAISGLAWTIVYVVSIRIGLRQRTYAMPIAALGLNLAWECLYAGYGLAKVPGGLQTWINLVWAVLDIAILVTFFRAARREFPLLPRALAHGVGVLMVVLGFAVQGLFALEFGSMFTAAVYSAFLQNALMSGLFLAMFVARGGSRGQSLVIAIAKWLGTLVPSVQLGILDHRWPFVVGLGLICTLLDLAYIGLLVWDRRRTLTAAARPVALEPLTAP